MKATQKPLLSIVVPVYNEEENVLLLFEKIETVCETIGEPYEVLFVDDGSRDKTFEVLAELHQQAPQVVVIRFEENAGQTAAMAAGFEFARGQRIISMDGDLQNDPADIPSLLQKLDEGYDLVCGWRKERHDKFWSRRVPSIVANWIIAKVTGVPIHDNGCSLKAYRAEMIKQVPLYGEMHRFIPAMSTVAGARISEIVVTHHPRRFGASKYGLGRVWRVMLDIIAFKLILSVFTPKSAPKGDSSQQQACDSQGSPKFRAFLVFLFLSALFFVSGCLLFEVAVLAAFSTFGLGIALIGLGLIAISTLAKAQQQEATELGILERFFMSRCARRPIRCFGPVGAMLFLIAGTLTLWMLNLPTGHWDGDVWLPATLTLWMPNLGAVLISIGVLIFCTGLLGELIAFANATRVTDYKVKTFLKNSEQGETF